MANALLLHGSSFIGSSAGQAYFWPGGRSTLHLSASQYGGGVFLQCLGPAGSGAAVAGRWAPVNGTTYSADQLTAYDLPAGQYRMISNQGSSVALIAALISVPYGV